VFRRRSTDEAVVDKPSDAAPAKNGAADRPSSQPSKGRATPTRREAEAARKRRLRVLPNDPKERRRAEREARGNSYQRQREAMRTGDARNYPARDQGPVKAFVRDYVDGRLRLLEFLMPVVAIAYLTLLTRSSVLYVYAQLIVTLVLLVGAVLGVALNIRVKRAVRDQFGEEHVRGTGFYALQRAALPRFLRKPKPVVDSSGKQK
jgi:hypothetical protein